MANTTKTGPKGAGEPAALLAASTPAPSKLSATVNLLDAMAQEGFDAIEALARVTLLALEAPATYGRSSASHELLAQVLTVIRDTAMRTRDNINAAAEDVGCNHADEDAGRRDAARNVSGTARIGEVTAP